MNKTIMSLLFFLALGLVTQAQSSPAPRLVDLKTSDGTQLKASYFAAAKPGPGVLLLHQANRDRKSWDSVASQLASAGINTLTLDMRGHGESGGKAGDKITDDIDKAFQYLVSQPGVNGDVIGAGGAGWLGVGYSVEVARQHSAQVKSLVLLSGETLGGTLARIGYEFLHKASQLPELFVFSDDDEYPPTQDAMKLLYVTAGSPSKKLVHYSAAEDAPWLWYETSDASKVPAKGGHGTDMFKVHPELPDIIVHWFVTTLIKTPGHAPADGLAAAPILNQLQTPGATAQITQQLLEARRKKIPKPSYGRKLQWTLSAKTISVWETSRTPSRRSSSTLWLIRILPTRTLTLPKPIWQTVRRTWRDSKPKNLSLFLTPISHPRRRGQIRSNAAERFVAT